MAVDRWASLEPTLAARYAMNRFLREALADGEVVCHGPLGSFPLDLIEHADRLEVRASLPGCRAEDIAIDASSSLLTISAETGVDAERERGGGIVRERRTGHFERSIRLPVVVKLDQASARCEHGEVIVTLPKAESTAKRRIPVEDGEKAAPARAPKGAAGSDQAQKPDHPNDHRKANVQQGGTNAPPDTYQPANSVHDDPVTEQSMESFPASDPPSWTPERI